MFLQHSAAGREAVPENSIVLEHSKREATYAQTSAFEPVKPTKCRNTGPADYILLIINSKKLR